jgi:hypothetical protein
MRMKHGWTLSVARSTFEVILKLQHLMQYTWHYPKFFALNFECCPRLRPVWGWEKWLQPLNVLPLLNIPFSSKIGIEIQKGPTHVFPKFNMDLWMWDFELMKIHHIRRLVKVNRVLFLIFFALNRYWCLHRYFFLRLYFLYTYNQVEFYFIFFQSCWILKLWFEDGET